MKVYVKLAQTRSLSPFLTYRQHLVTDRFIPNLLVFNRFQLPMADFPAFKITKSSSICKLNLVQKPQSIQL